MGLVLLFIKHWEIAAALACLGVVYWLWAIRTHLYGVLLVAIAEKSLQRKDYERAFAVATRLLREYGFPWPDRENEEWRVIRAAAHCVRGTRRSRWCWAADAELRRQARQERRCDCADASPEPERRKGPAVAG